MKWFLATIFLFFTSLSFADSETTISGKVAQAHIVQSGGTSLRPRPYLNFNGGIACSDVGGKTVCASDGLVPYIGATGSVNLGSNAIVAGTGTFGVVNYGTLNPPIDFSDTVQYCNGHPELYDVCLEWDDVALSLWIGGQNQGQWPYPALDYIAEYTGANPVYEGWAVYIENGVNTASLVWRIAKNTFDGANKTRTGYAGAGEFAYAWDLKLNYFESGIAQYLLIDSDNYLIIDNVGHKVRIQ